MQLLLAPDAETAALAAHMERAGLTPARSRDKLSASERRYLSGPIVVADHSWGETIPQWLRDAVETARLGMVLAGEKEIASEEEVVAYLYTASLAAPLGHEWAAIYLVTAARVLARWGKLESPTEFWRSIGGWRKESLTPYQEEMLRRLRHDIRRSVEHARR